MTASRPDNLSSARANSDVTASQKGSPVVLATGNHDESMYSYEVNPLKSAGMDDCKAASRSCKGFGGRPAWIRTNRTPERTRARPHAHILVALFASTGPDSGGSDFKSAVQNPGVDSLAGHALQGSSCRFGGVSA